MSERPKRRKKESEAEVTFEEALARLEEIADKLESGDLALEAAIALAEEGIRLSRTCEEQLTAAEGKIQQLVERMGTVELEPMDSEEADDDEEE